SKLQSCFVVSNEIVVHNEYLFAPAESKKSVELSDQLRRRLRSRAASVKSDNVAEFTGERAASRKLHRHHSVLLQCQQIETWCRSSIDIGFYLDTIHPAGRSDLEIRCNFSEDFVRLAHNHMVG